MMTEQDMKRILPASADLSDPLTGSVDLDIDDDDERELIEFLELESLELEYGSDCGI